MLFGSYFASYISKTLYGDQMHRHHNFCFSLTLEPHPKKLTLLASGVRLDPKAVMDFQSMNPSLIWHPMLHTSEQPLNMMFLSR